MNDPETVKCCWKDFEEDGYPHHFRDYVDTEEGEVVKDIARRYVKYHKINGLLGIGDAAYHRHDASDEYDTFKRTVTTGW